MHYIILQTQSLLNLLGFSNAYFFSLWDFSAKKNKKCGQKQIVPFLVES